jgi:riboflavin synthase
MFTGLVQAVGTLREVTPTPAGVRLVLDPHDLLAASAPAPAFQVGESVSVNGVCLTLAADPGVHAGRLSFDAIPETLRRTSLGRLVPGDRVNLERSVTPATLLGGHIVQGHVDGVGDVVGVQATDDWRIRIKPRPLPDANPMEYLVPKGSVTVEGVSLTVAALGGGETAGGGGAPEWFEVALIPTTLAKTTLRGLRAGDTVNLEFDAVAKTIVHWLRHFGPSSPAPARRL